MRKEESKYIEKGELHRMNVSFGVIADLQYCDAPPIKNRFFRNAPDKLNIALKEFSRYELDFVINLGDSIDRDWQSFEGILPLLESSNVPVYHVLGNHDYEVASQFKTEVHRKIGTQKHYVFPMKNWLFIVLDGNEISTFANTVNSENKQKAEELLLKLEQQHRVNANFWNGGIGELQRIWLENTLEKASKNHQHVIIFCHYPVFPVDRHNLLNDQEILSVIGKHSCVKAWVNGHNHEGNYGQWKNIHFINMKGMVETEKELAFAIVTLTKDHISINGFGSERSARLSIR